MRALVLTAAFVLIVSAGQAGQTARIEIVLPPVFIDAEPSEPPGEPGAWALRVISRGGLHGGGAADLTIRSDGTMTSIGGNPSPTVHPDTLTTLGQRIRAAIGPRWSVESRLGICSDCVATLVVLAVRAQNGLVETRAAYWDSTTRRAVPPELLRLHEIALTVQR